MKFLNWLLGQNETADVLERTDNGERTPSERMEDALNRVVNLADRRKELAERKRQLAEETLKAIEGHTKIDNELQAKLDELDATKRGLEIESMRLDTRELEGRIEFLKRKASDKMTPQEQAINNAEVAQLVLQRGRFQNSIDLAEAGYFSENAVRAQNAKREKRLSDDLRKAAEALKKIT